MRTRWTAGVTDGVEEGKQHAREMAQGPMSGPSSLCGELANVLGLECATFTTAQLHFEQKLAPRKHSPVFFGRIWLWQIFLFWERCILRHNPALNSADARQGQAGATWFIVELIFSFHNIPPIVFNLLHPVKWLLLRCVFVQINVAHVRLMIEDCFEALCLGRGTLPPPPRGVEILDRLGDVQKCCVRMVL